MKVLSQGFRSLAQLFSRVLPQGASTQYARAVSYRQQRQYGEAANLLRLAADKGHAKAQHDLGLCYKHAQGVPLDYIKATEFFGRSADQGVAEAQAELGLCYLNGEGVSQNREKAIELFKLAADQGCVRAHRHLGETYLTGNGIDYTQAARHFCWARQKGDEDALDFFMVFCETEITNKMVKSYILDTILETMHPGPPACSPT